MKSLLNRLLKPCVLTVALFCVAGTSYAGGDQPEKILNTDWSMAGLKGTWVLEGDRQLELFTAKLHGDFTAGVVAARLEQRFSSGFRVNGEYLFIQNKGAEEQRFRSTVGKAFMVGPWVVEPGLLVEYRDQEKGVDHFRYRPKLSVMNREILAKYGVFPFAQTIYFYDESVNEDTLTVLALGFKWHISKDMNFDINGYRARIPQYDMYTTGASIYFNKIF